MKKKKWKHKKTEEKKEESPAGDKKSVEGETAEEATAEKKADGDEKADSHWATLQSNLATMANTVNERV